MDCKEVASVVALPVSDASLLLLTDSTAEVMATVAAKELLAAAMAAMAAVLEPLSPPACDGGVIMRRGVVSAPACADEVSGGDVLAVDDTLTLVEEAPISIHPDENPAADELADWKAEPIGLEDTSGAEEVVWACKVRVSGTPVAPVLVFPTSSIALEVDEPECVSDGKLVLGADTISVCQVGLIGRSSAAVELDGVCVELVEVAGTLVALDCRMVASVVAFIASSLVFLTTSPAVVVDDCGA